VVKHKIECIGNSDGTFHFEAGAPVRQIGDRTIDQRLMTFEDDARSLENAAAARFIPELLLWVIHLFDLPPYAPRCVSRRIGRTVLLIQKPGPSSARQCFPSLAVELRRAALRQTCAN
jgi:hypothetical protein